LAFIIVDGLSEVKEKALQENRVTTHQWFTTSGQVVGGGEGGCDVGSQEDFTQNSKIMKKIKICIHIQTI
jgi:hypothetical protein